jgi:hypothetical protein
MSMFSNNSRHNCFGSAALFAVLGLMATAAFGGVVSHPPFSTDQVAFTGITESTISGTGLFIPPDPVASLSGSSNELAFYPNRFILTDQSLSFDIKSLSSQLGMFVSGKVVSGTAGPIGYELETLNLNIKGSYSLLAPFATVPPPGSGASEALVQMNNVPLTIKVTGVNWSEYARGIALGATLNVSPNNVTAVGPNGSASGIWSGSYAVDMNALRAAAGILPTDSITQVQIQATATVYAASMYASAQSSVTNFDVQTNVEAVAVPEPPTVILAGLGVAAAVGQGYRRRKSRRNAEAGAEMASDEIGAIALTA